MVPATYVSLHTSQHRPISLNGKTITVSVGVLVNFSSKMRAASVSFSSNSTLKYDRSLPGAFWVLGAPLRITPICGNPPSFLSVKPLIGIFHFSFLGLKATQLNTPRRCYSNSYHLEKLVLEKPVPGIESGAPESRCRQAPQVAIYRKFLALKVIPLHTGLGTRPSGLDAAILKVLRIGCRPPQL